MLTFRPSPRSLFQFLLFFQFFCSWKFVSKCYTMLVPGIGWTTNDFRTHVDHGFLHLNVYLNRLRLALLKGRKNALNEIQS